MTKMFTKRQLRGAALSGALVLMTASAAHSIAQEQAACPSNTQCVSIAFDGNGCPTSATPAMFDIENNKRVQWQSVPAESYEIYFDPFKGQPHKSNSNGELKSNPFDTKSPATASGIAYKYTIVGDKCPNAPLDPGFRLRR